MGSVSTYFGLNIDINLNPSPPGNQVVWFDAATGGLSYRTGTLILGLTSPAAGAKIFWHRTDSGFRNSTWTHGDFFIPANIGVPLGNGEVKVRYYYSDSALDVTAQAGRDALELLFSAYKTQTEMRALDPASGRYRYLGFQLNTDGVQDSYVSMWGGPIEKTTIPDTPLDFVVVDIDDLQIPTEIEIPRGNSRLLTFRFRSESKRLDITGGRVFFALHKTKSGLPLSSPDLGPLEAALGSDPTQGEASLQIASAHTDREARLYIGEVLLIQGTKRLSKVFPVRISTAVIPASFVPP